MRKIILIILFFSLLIFSACSVQEKMSPEIFFERLSNVNSEMDFENSEQFVQEDKNIVFIKNKNGTDFVFELSVNESGDAEKISLACAQTDKVSDFIHCVEAVIKTYSPSDDTAEILSALFENGQIKQEYAYHDTQWHGYAAVASENTLYFSITNKKLVPQNEVELSLKPNDRVDF